MQGGEYQNFLLNKKFFITCFFKPLHRCNYCKFAALIFLEEYVYL